MRTNILYQALFSLCILFKNVAGVDLSKKKNNNVKVNLDLNMNYVLPEVMEVISTVETFVWDIVGG